MFHIVENDTPPLPQGCSEFLKDFLRQCFNKDPSKRPTAEQLCEHEWLKRTRYIPFPRSADDDIQPRSPRRPFIEVLRERELIDPHQSLVKSRWPISESRQAYVPPSRRYSPASAASPSRRNSPSSVASSSRRNSPAFSLLLEVPRSSIVSGRSDRQHSLDTVNTDATSIHAYDDNSHAPSLTDGLGRKSQDLHRVVEEEEAERSAPSSPGSKKKPVRLTPAMAKLSREEDAQDNQHKRRRQIHPDKAQQSLAAVRQLGQADEESNVDTSSQPPAQKQVTRPVSFLKPQLRRRDTSSDQKSRCLVQ
jgi:serine/threonine protein kinase